MIKAPDSLTAADPYFSGGGGFIGATLFDLHADMEKLELPRVVPDSIRRVHDAICHAYIYSYFSYDLLTIAAAQAFPCLELALRERLSGLGVPVANPKTGRTMMMSELLKLAKARNLITSDIKYVAPMRNMFAHGSDTVLNPAMFLATFDLVTGLIKELYTTA